MEEEISLKMIKELWSKIENKDECRKIIEIVVPYLVRGKLTCHEAVEVITNYKSKVTSRIPFLWKRNSKKLLDYLEDTRQEVDDMSEVNKILGLRLQDSNISKTLSEVLANLKNSLDE